MEEETIRKNASDQKQNFINRYEQTRTIGQGSYGKIIEAFDKDLNRRVILKKFIFFDSDDGLPSNCLREVSILKHVSHKNILQIQGFYYFIEDRSAYLVCELLDTDLNRFIKDKHELLLQNGKLKIKQWFYQLVSGVYYLHINNIIHRDLKPANILVNESKNLVKIGDFGLSRYYQKQNEKYTNEVETLNYRSPELILGEQQYQTELDIWSLGCIFYEMHAKKQLFSQNNEIGLLFDIFKLLGTPSTESWKEMKSLKNYSPHFPNFKPNYYELVQQTFGSDRSAIELFIMMMQVNPNNRAHIIDVIDHPYFNDLK